MIEIAGDILEGGGQIVRTSIALAALLGKSVRITRIRARRPNPGLQAQHLTAVKAVANLCDAETEGLTLGSTVLTFIPKGAKGGSFRFDIGTAGSISLVLQALMPAAAFAKEPVTFELSGGTDVKWSPTVDYVRLVVVPILQKLGYKMLLALHRRGHYPKGGGRVTATIQPAGSLSAVRLTDRGSLRRIFGISHCVKLPDHIARRQAAAATDTLTKLGYPTAEVRLESYPASADPHLGPGSGIVLVAEAGGGVLLGADNLGERGKPSETVGREAAEKLSREIQTKTAVDRHMADILIPYMVVAQGQSSFSTSEITMHTMTNIKIAELLAPVKFDVQEELGTPGVISVHGLGLSY